MPGHMHSVQSSYILPSYKDFLMSNFADSKDILCTNRTLSRPTLPIAVTETIVKAQGGVR